MALDLLKTVCVFKIKKARNLGHSFYVEKHVFSMSIKKILRLLAVT